MTSKRLLGDFQTPLPLACQVLRHLEQQEIKWTRILEPTCGQGNFIQALVQRRWQVEEIYGIELQHNYAIEAQKRFQDYPQIHITQGNIFSTNTRQDIPWQTRGELLILGNPPWVNNSTSGVMDGENLPVKTNFKHFKGIEAITGKANFDIAEYIWLKCLREWQDDKVTFAWLVKQSVARHILQYARNAKLPLQKMQIYPIDSKQWFGAAVDACLCVAQFGQGQSLYQAELYTSLDDHSPYSRMGFVNEAFVADIARYKMHTSIEERAYHAWEWRSGFKHDAGSVMELQKEDGVWINGLQEIVDVEADYLYPLVKSSDVQYLSNGLISRAVVVPQKQMGENTQTLRWRAPKLWVYLTNHQAIFAERKSRIYVNKPAFSTFGLGEYSFASYKVIVSGFYRRPRFVAVGLYQHKAVFVDDTCYQLAFNNPSDALMIAALLNSSLCQDWLDTLIFANSKRPITKQLLERINLVSLLDETTPRELLRTSQHEITRSVGFEAIDLTKSDIDQLRERLTLTNQQILQPLLM